MGGGIRAHGGSLGASKLQGPWSGLYLSQILTFCFLSFLLPSLPSLPSASLLPFLPLSHSSFLPLYPHPVFRLLGVGGYSSFSAGPFVPCPSCPGGQSWSPDLDKCMDCTICLQRTKNDFCATCGEPQPQDAWLWLAVGGAVGGVAVLGLVGGALLWARCRKREKFTSDHPGPQTP
uniref:Uncharacterized protein n=1 Tax=Chrysemys picta bellii TaxID=8478 RepID=A0A8C3HXW7_CHRPI